MKTLPETGLARVLASPSYLDPAELAAAWFDQSFTFRLRGVARAPMGIGAHLRRSFLGALGQGASTQAQAGHPCPWDPPCALDVFCREQLRGARGDGLPKPYTIRAWPRGGDLMVRLRLFGMANDWAMAAAEAMVIGLRDILPWPRVLKGQATPPEIITRQVAPFRPGPSVAPQRVTMVFLSLVDATGADLTRTPHSLLTRLLRRVDAMARWNGTALPPETGAALARHAAGLEYDLSALRPGRSTSPNRHAQTRCDPALGGALVIQGDLTPLWPILKIGERCHVGRHAVEGLGAFRLD